MKDYISDCYAIIADEVTGTYSNKPLCLGYVKSCGNEKPYICEIFFDFLHIQGKPSCQTIGNSILLLLPKK